MAMDIGTLVGYLELDTSRFDKPLGEAANRFPSWMGAAAGAAAVAVGAGLFAIGDKFDEMNDTIRTKTGATGDELDGLVDIAKTVGSEVPAEFSKVGDTVADLNTRLGLTGEDLTTVAKQVLEAGRILGEDVDIDSTTAAFQAFGIEGDAVSGAMDTLFQVSQATGVGMNELASGVQTVAPALQELGFSFEDSVALMGSLDKAGLNSEQILGGLSKGMVNLAKAGEDPQTAFQRVSGEIESFVKSGDKAAALDLAAQVFGTKGAAQFVGALESGVLNMEDLMGATGATGDTILGVGEETMDFAERWQMTMNQAMIAIEPLANAVFSAVGDGLTAVMPHLTAFGEWAQENPGFIQGVAIGLGILAAAIVVLTAVQWALNLAFLANPITWIVIAIIAAIALLIAVIWVLVANWDQIWAWISATWEGFVGWFTGVMDGFVSWWNEMWAGFGSWVTQVWEGFVGWIEGVWSGFVGWLQGIGNGLASWWNGLWSSIGAFVQQAWNNLVAGVTILAMQIVSFLMGKFAEFTGFWSGLWNGVSSTVRSIWDGITGFLSGIPGMILGYFSNMGSLLYNSGKSLIEGFIGGIQDMIGSVGDAIGGVLDFAAGFFPHSPAKRGPFSGAGWDAIGDAGQALMDEFASGTDLNGFMDGTLSLPAGAGSSGAARSGGGEWHYHAAEHQSLSSEEALFAALGSPRNPFGGN